MNYLQTPIEFLKGVGPQRAELIKKELEINTFDDLLHYFPFRYIDRSKIHSINEINPFTQFIQLKGVVKGFKMEGSGRVKRLKAVFVDSTGTIDLVWFQGADWMMKNIKTNVEYVKCI
jgi:ATP-dependent DNA helicase RecG